MASPDTANPENEAVKFHADAHVYHIHDIFPYYALQLSRWAACKITDNCPREFEYCTKNRYHAHWVYEPQNASRNAKDY